MAKTKLRWGRIGGVLALLLGGVLVGLFFARHAIATSIAQDQLSERGLVCEELSLNLSASFDEVEVAPTRCTHETGIVEVIELVSSATVQLDGTEPTHIEAQTVRLTLRNQDLRGGGQWATPLRRLGLEQKVAGLLKGASEVSTLGLPETTLANVEVQHGTVLLGRAHGVTLRPAEAGIDLELARLGFAMGPLNSGTLELSRLRVQASRPRVHLEADAEGSVGIGPLRMAQRGHVIIDATGLDTAQPSFTLGGDF